MKRFLISLIFVFSGLFVFSQQWGLYTLYSTTGSTTTYLIDTANTPATYKTWTHTSSRKTGYSSYMIEGDTLVRTVQNSGSFGGGGGVTGGVQKVTWDGTVAWDFTYNSTTYCLHHDICPMPNGNVLMICYEYKTATEATAMGCSSGKALNSEKIIEVKPTGATTGTIVWEWHVWDHMCQNVTSSKPGYVTSIVQNPQLFNINYGTSGGMGTVDWLHMNGIDYNEELDQITFSSHALNEIYIIDHSTTTAEAATHAGGNSGKGGDLLYRWGNPAAYSASGTTIFDVVHDAHWVPSDNPEHPDCLAAMNNGGGTGGKAAIDIISPPINIDNTYNITLGQAYTPSTYTDRFNTAYTSQGQGNSEQFPNGNMLLCVPSTSATYVYEINSAGTSLWSKNISGQLAQAHRYEKCFIRPVNAIVSASDLSVCLGDASVLTTTATAITETSPTYTYSWSSLPAGFSSSLANPSVYPTEATTYTVIVTNVQSGCTDQVSVSIAVNDSPEAFAGNDVTINSGNSAILTATGDGSYHWSTGANTQSITVYPAETTTYSVTVTNANDCTDTDEVVVYVGSGTLSVNASADESTVCAGDPVQLSATPSGGSDYTYIWSSTPVGFTSDLQNPIAYPTVNTTYQVVVTSGMDDVANSVSVSVNALPNVPVISLNGLELQSTAATSYQWYLNGVVIDGATSQNYSPSETGNYQVEITNAEDCSNISDEFYYVVENSPILNSSDAEISIFPNPNSGIFEIVSYEEFSYDIISASGNKILSGQNSGNVDLSHLAGGVYYILLKTDNFVRTEKLILIK